jgi:catechol 2,3-dioxygenase-like lactoylglutathione lyase family enzyme
MAATPALDFVLFYVADLEQSLSYYSDRLGFKRVTDQDGPDFRYLTTGSGGPDFGLLQVRAGTPAAGTVELYFKTYELEQLRADLTARNVETTPVVQRPFGSIFSVSSPDGNLLTMMAPPAQG